MKERPIRSFVRREGRMTDAQALAFSQLWPVYGLEPLPHTLIDFKTIFQRDAEVVLEIGFGDGESLATMAKNAPHQNFLGIEVYRTGIARLLKRADEAQITNLRVICADAIDVLQNHIADNTLSTVQLFFADPWPKKKHHKRRIVQDTFLKLIAQKLKSGGLVHLATDWMDYAYQMMAVFEASSDFVNVSGQGQFTVKPDFRPTTKYEKRGLRLGHSTWDLMFRR